MLINKIHHAAIICSDYEKTKDFYTNILGFPIIQEHYQPNRGSYKLDLQIGDSQLEIFYFKDSPKRLSYPEACGLRHLAFDTDDIEATVMELRNKGVLVQEIRMDEYTNTRFAFFEDPDGLPLELHE